MRRINSRAVRVAAIAAALVAAFFASSGVFAAGYTESVLYGFCNQCSTGYEPRAGLYEDASQNLFGTTFGGGRVNGGTVYELAYNSANQKYAYKVLHSFCSSTGCTDGGGTVSGLIADGSGNLYGTTIFGGANDKGTVYELSFNQGAHRWSYKVLYSFCASANCTDGATPHSGVISDPSGNLYGTTHDGGAQNVGTVYELVFNQTKRKFAERVLYSFTCGTESCPTGASPDVGLLLGADGNLYGATPLGANSAGNVFELKQASRKWLYKDIYDFCAQQACPDGATPSGRLIEDTHGTLYSTTNSGGVHGQGVVYSLTPNSREKVLYSFCNGQNCPDGQSPAGNLLLDASQNLIGTTDSGGAHNSGTVYKLTGRAHIILYSFCALPNCADGSVARSGVIEDASGNLFGTTEGGGVLGTVFKLSPSN